MSLRAWGRAALLVAAVFGVAFVVGVDLVHCVLLAAGTLLLALLRRLPEVEGDEWPEREPDASDRGVRREVARLSWGLHGFESRVDRRSVHRLHAIALRRLHGCGVDLDDPADAERARQLLGPGPYAAVTSDPSTLPRFDVFARAVRAVEALPRSSDHPAARPGRTT